MIIFHHQVDRGGGSHQVDRDGGSHQAEYGGYHSNCRPRRRRRLVVHIVLASRRPYRTHTTRLSPRVSAGPPGVHHEVGHGGSLSNVRRRRRRPDHADVVTRRLVVAFSRSKRQNPSSLQIKGLVSHTDDSSKVHRVDKS